MNRYKKVILLIGLGVFLFINMISAIAQDDKVIQLQADYSAFRYQADRLNCEFYYSVYHIKPDYERVNDNQYRWLGEMQLLITQDTKTIFDEKWKIQGTATDLTEGVPPVSLLDRVPYIMPAGEYRVMVKVIDLAHPQLQDSVLFGMTLKGFDSDKVTFSDIQLASQIQRGALDTANPFYKNTLLVIPNPSRIFGKTIPFLHFYAEVYQLGLIPQGAAYTFTYQVKDANKMLIPNVKPVVLNRTRKVEATVETGTVNVGSLPSGTYTLEVALADGKGAVLGKNENMFFIFNPDIKAATNMADLNMDELYSISEFADFDEKKLKNELELIEYLATDKDRTTLKLVDQPEEQKKWLFRFWKKYDPNFMTPVNEFRVEYMKRVDYSNRNFSGFRVKGWKSDRGRIYILYGEPTYVENYPNESGMRPHLIWKFDQLQNGVEFVFVDFNQNKEYRLVHSDLMGEIQNENWMEQATKGVY